MPKMKSHRGLAKRVKKTGSGKLKRSHAYTSHRFHGKAASSLGKIRCCTCYRLQTYQGNVSEIGRNKVWQELKAELYHALEEKES